MNEKELIYKYQFGFRQKTLNTRSNNISCLLITKSLDSGDIVIGFFLDLKKAFDNVNHRIL